MSVGQQLRFRLLSTIDPRAHQAVAKAVRLGQLPSHASCLCLDCGQPATAYHHYLGYAPEHWLDVQPLCETCHHTRHHPETKGMSMAKMRSMMRKRTVEVCYGCGHKFAALPDQLYHDRSCKARHWARTHTNTGRPAGRPRKAQTLTATPPQE